jgi:spermidine synthase
MDYRDVSRPSHPFRSWKILALAICCLWVPAWAAVPATKSSKYIELDTKSEYSHIRVKRQGSLRSLIFVRDNGDEVEETMVNLKKPYELLAPYTRAMFASYLFRPKQERVLLVGLGGGAMVHFLKHYDPKVQVEAVEIDPAVVEIADRYFDVRSEGNVKIITADAFKYLEKTEARYDVIYMDAFLKPAADTDPTGVPLRLKTAKFYKGLQEKLAADGVVVFNLNRYKTVDDDVKAIRAAFAQVYVCRTQGGNEVVVASTSSARETPAALQARAKEIDQQFKATFSFQDLASRLGK